MKKIILIVALLLSGFVYQTASAQIHVSIRANIGVQPVWGPVGYDYVEYYYMPDIDVFYNVQRHLYIYEEGGQWIFVSSLPYRFRDYDIHNGYKVVINDDPRPYRNAENYRAKYSGYKGHHDQEEIRSSHDSRYFQIKDHPEHNKWKQEQNRGNRGNRGRGHNNNDNNNKRN